MHNRFLPVLILFTLLFFSCTCLAQETPKTEGERPGKNSSKQDKVKWYSFEEAYKLNKKKPRKIIIDVYTEWCGWCKKMDAETFTNPVIVKYLNKTYYCVKLDAERKDTIIIDGVTFVNPNPNGRRTTHQLAVELLKGKMSYPSYVFLNEKSQWLTVIPGYHPAKEFEVYLHYFGDDAYQATPWEDFQTSFTGDL
jgi:thioredoxin-related protein